MKRRSMHAVLTMALAAAMTLGNVPITSFAASVESEAVDEEYQAAPTEDATEETAAEEEAAPEEPAEAEEAAPAVEEDTAEEADSVTVDKTALADAIAAAQALNEADYTEDSWSSLQTALTNAQTVNDQSDATQDVVDTATMELTDAQNALESDLDAANVDEYNDGEIYVLMNIPYDVFYSAENVSVDAVASATTKVRDSDRAGASYNGSGNATDTENVTVQSKGVQFPVKVSDQSLLTNSKYTEVTDSTSYTTVAVLHGQATNKTYTGKGALIQADDYAYYKLSETPAYYVELNSDGTFSAVQGTKTSATGSADSITYGGRHRSYEIKLPDSVSGQIAGVTVTTDKLTFGLKTTDEIFNKDREIGWDPKGDLTSTNGATLQSVTVYTDTGVYNVSYNVKLKENKDATIGATLKDNAGIVTSLPQDIENPKAAISYTEGSGRNAKTTTYVADAVVNTKDGTFEIPYTAGLKKGTEYTVTVSSDNFMDLSTKATYEDTTSYVLMNIPYDVFYKIVGTGVDATSGATAKVRNAGVAGATYNGEGNVTKDTPASISKGVQFAVRVTNPDLLKNNTEVTDSTSYHVVYSGRGQTTETDVTGKAALIQADDYAYYKLSDAPSSYVALTGENRFESGVAGATTSLTGNSDNITYGGHHRTYEINIQKDGVSGTVAGATVTTDKGTFGLKATDQLWRSQEIGWDPKGDLANTNGATLQSITVYTVDNGVYIISYENGVKLKTNSDATIASTLKDNVGTVTRLPDDISSPKATVTHTEGTGRNAVTTTYVTDAEVTDGTFEIPFTAGLKNGTEYTVTVSSDNYLDLSTKATYEDTTEYVLMNIPYDVFYSNEGIGVDATSGATAKVRNSALAGSTYNGGENATNTENVTDTSKGVTFAVRVTDPNLLKDSKYTAVTDDTSYSVQWVARGKASGEQTVSGKNALIQSPDYAYYVLSDDDKAAVSSYVVLTSDGFSGVVGDVTELEGSSDDITFGGHHATYEISLPDSVFGVADNPVTIAAAVVTTDKGTFGLTATDQLWRSIEVGWTPEGDLANTNGATLQSIKVYTDQGVYNITYGENGTKLKTRSLSDTTISAELKDSTGTVSGLPSGIQNPTVTVYAPSTNNQGRTVLTAVTGLEGVTLNDDGTFTIPESAGLENDKEYTVTVSSDNYLDLSATATYSKTGGSGNKDTGVYTITFNANGGTIKGSDKATTKDGKLTSALPDATKEGSTFDGWYTTENGGDQVTADTVFAANTTLYAHWTAKGTPEPAATEYTITFDPNGGTLDKAKTTAVTADGKLTAIPTPTRNGYTFDAWYTEKDGKGTKVTKDTSFTADTTVYANWKKGGNPTPQSGNGNDNGSSSSTGNVKTGDTAQPVLWATISAAAVAAIAIALVLRRRNRKRS